MSKQGLDAVVAVSPENFFYTTGAYISTQKLLRDRLALAVVTMTGDPIVIVCNIEESFTREESRFPDIRTYVEFAQSPIDVLAEVLQEAGVANGRIGMEMRYLSWHYSQELLRRAPLAQFQECRHLFNEIRMKKQPHEVEVLERAARVTAEAVQSTMQTVRPGDTERSLAIRLRQALLGTGAEELAFLVLGTGVRSSITHPIPSDVPLVSGDVIKLDIGGLYGGYYSDLARTFGFGERNTRRHDIYRRLAEIHRSVIGEIRPGVRCCDVFKFCQTQFERHGLEFHMPHIGHSLGVELHEYPMIEPSNQQEIEEGMILNIEPIFNDPFDGSGYHIEDLVLVTASGTRVLTGSDLDTEMQWYGG